MMRPPENIFAKVQRAREHLDAFRHEVKCFLLSNPQGLTSELAVKGDDIYEVIIGIAITKHPPVRLSILSGEIAYQLRSCLDHLVYSLSLRLAPSTKELKTVEFPIFASEESFRDTNKHGIPKRGSGLYTIRFIDPAAQAIIEGLQPYKARQNAELHPLWVLHELCNIDKHRHLQFLGNPIGAISILKDFYGPFQVIRSEEFGGRPLKDGTVIAKVLIRGLPGFQRKVRVKGQVPGEVAFEEAIALPQKYASEVLEDILTFVETQVIPPLRVYLPP
jgi:hypothetical protein